jgi:phage tail sheath protein FI
MAILDIPSSLQKVQDAIGYRTDQLALNSSYSAIYSPDLLILDPYSSRRLYVPPSGYIAAKKAKEIQIQMEVELNRI